MLGDIVVPVGFGRGDPERDESIADFVSRRFGAEAAERIASPLLGGIYAGDVRELSLRATFPQLAELEQRFGSVILGLCAPSAKLPDGVPRTLGERAARIKSVLGWLRRDEGAPAESPFLSLRGGMGRLIERLAGRARARRCASARPCGASAGARSGFSVELDGETLGADAVLLAAPAHVAAGLVPSSELSRELGAIRYTSTATVFFAFDRESVRHPLHGSGFVVPKGEGDLLAATWISSKWDGRAPEGSVLLRAFVGGTSGAGAARAQRRRALRHRRASSSSACSGRSASRSCAASIATSAPIRCPRSATPPASQRLRDAARNAARPRARRRGLRRRRHPRLRPAGGSSSRSHRAAAAAPAGLDPRRALLLYAPLLRRRPRAGQGTLNP